jgi:hypothetical protein
MAKSFPTASKEILLSLSYTSVVKHRVLQKELKNVIRNGA